MWITTARQKLHLVGGLDAVFAVIGVLHRAAVEAAAPECLRCGAGSLWCMELKWTRLGHSDDTTKHEHIKPSLSQCPVDACQTCQCAQADESCVAPPQQRSSTDAA